MTLYLYQRHDVASTLDDMCPLAHVLHKLKAQCKMNVPVCIRNAIHPTDKILAYILPSTENDLHIFLTH